jgi:hypothetical protein
MTGMRSWIAEVTALIDPDKMTVKHASAAIKPRNWRLMGVWNSSFVSHTSPPERGWTTRNDRPGRNPNTEDLRYLSRDFAEVTDRTTQIASAQISTAIQVWDKRLAIGTFILTSAGRKVMRLTCAMY